MNYLYEFILFSGLRNRLKHIRQDMGFTIYTVLCSLFQICPVNISLDKIWVFQYTFSNLTQLKVKRVFKAVTNV